MKKKVLFALFAAAVLALGVFSFAACRDGYEYQASDFSLTS